MFFYELKVERGFTTHSRRAGDRSQQGACRGSPNEDGIVERDWELVTVIYNLHEW